MSDLEPAGEEYIRVFVTAVTGGGSVDTSITRAAAILSIAVSMKRIADAVVADIERHNDEVPGPLNRIADVVAGKIDGSTMDLTNGIMHAIEQGILSARR